MKRKVIIGMVMCLMAVNAKAQVYAGDSWTQLPTMDLYDTGAMNMHLRALAETSTVRQRNYLFYSDLAMEAFKNKQWNYVIKCVNDALSTQFYCGQLYFLRGYALEQLGDLRAAKKDYKTGAKYDCSEAAQALAALKARKKRK